MRIIIHIFGRKIGVELKNLHQSFFQNRASVIFALYVLIILSLAAFLYYYSEKRERMINTVTSTTIACLLYITLIMVRFVQWSWKLSDLETYQIKLIEAQKLVLQREIVLLCDDLNSSQKLIQKYFHTSKYLDSMIVHIQKISISPKIAGLALDQAFVRLAMTTFFGALSFALTYYIRTIFLPNTMKQQN